MEQRDYTMEAFHLSQEIEHGFTRFPCEFPFGRNLIVSEPANAIELGLTYLECLSAISKVECHEHLSNFNWGTLRLEDAIKDSTKKDFLDALVRNLEYWHNRYSEKMADVEETEE